MDPLPPDPYLALGVPKDATQAAIKTAYRKLALKSHPDKVPGKGDEFHKISTAYELIGEEDSRSRYDADVRLHALKKEQASRFGSGYRGGPDIRTAAFDVRSSPNPDFQFRARGPPRYETAERRPGSYAGTPKATPRAYADDAGDYFGSAATAKKYAGDDEPKRRSTQKSAPREEERKPKLKKEHSDTKSKVKEVREETRRQRDTGRDKERKEKKRSTPAPSVYSDSDSGSDATPVRAYANQENIRRGTAFVRKKEHRKSDEEFYEKTRRPELSRTSTAQQYIRSSRTDSAPVESGAAPPAYANGSRRERSISPHSRDRTRDDIQVPKFRHTEGRPEFVRRSSARPKEEKKAATPESSRTKRPTMPRTGSSRRSPSADARAPPPKPKLFTAQSEPQNLKHMSEEADPRRERERSYTAEPYREEVRTAPKMKRSETAPASKLFPPKQSSGLRNVESHSNNINNDSGYSTSSPSEDSPPQTGKQHRYTDRDQEDLRERDRDRDRDREYDPPRRPPLEKERSSRGAPPPSRSASYAYNDIRDSDPENRSPTSSRRPSLTPRDSDRRTSARDEPLRRATLNHSESQRGASHDIPIRPSLDRSSSQRGSSRDVPTMQRGQTMPSIRTGFNDPYERSRADPTPLFGEKVPFSRSPVNTSGDDSEIEDYPRRGSPRERERPSSKFMRNAFGEDSGYGSRSQQTSSGRRVSEDYEKSRMYGAERYMDETSRPESRRRPSYV